MQEITSEVQALKELVRDLHHAIYNYVDPSELEKLDERVAAATKEVD